MHPFLKRLFASAAGIIVGTFLANDLVYFWLLGVLAGGAVGYVCYDIPDTIKSTKTAYRDVIGWKPDMEYWRNYFELLKGYLVVSVAVGSLVGWGFGLVAFTLVSALGSNPLIPFVATFSAIFALISVMFSLVSVYVAFLELRDLSRKPGLLKRKIWVLKMQDFREARKLNAVNVTLYVIKHFLRLVRFGSVAIAKFVVYCLKTAWRFVKRAIHYMHSHQREQVICDVLLGSTIGWLYNNTMIGLAVGVGFAVTTIAAEDLFVRRTTNSTDRK